MTARPDYRFDELLTPQQVAAHLGVAVGTLTQWRYKGTGPGAIKVGKAIRYPTSAITSWLASRPAVCPLPLVFNTPRIAVVGPRVVRVIYGSPGSERRRTFPTREEAATFAVGVVVAALPDVHGSVSDVPGPE